MPRNFEHYSEDCKQDIVYSIVDIRSLVLPAQYPDMEKLEDNIAERLEDVVVQGQFRKRVVERLLLLDNEVQLLLFLGSKKLQDCPQVGVLLPMVRYCQHE